MNKLKGKIRFFITGFHQGTVNRVLHALGIALLLYAILIKSITYVVAAIIIMELGHWHQYHFSDLDYKSKVKGVLLIQISLIIFVVSTLLVYFN